MGTSNTYRPNSHKMATSGVETNLKNGTLIGGRSQVGVEVSESWNKFGTSAPL